MLKHVIIWHLKDTYSQEEKDAITKDIKEALEGLKGRIDGLLDIRVYRDLLPTSSGDVMLVCDLKDAEALNHYATHPEHVHVAETKIKPFAKIRSCVDYLV